MKGTRESNKTLEIFKSRLDRFKLPKAYKVKEIYEDGFLSSVELRVNDKVFTKATEEELNDFYDPIIHTIDKMKFNADKRSLGIDIMKVIATYSKEDSIKVSLDKAYALTLVTECLFNKRIEFDKLKFDDVKKDYIIHVKGHNYLTKENMKASFYSTDIRSIKRFIRDLNTKELENGWNIFIKDNGYHLEKEGYESKSSTERCEFQENRIRNLIDKYDGYNNKNDNLLSKCESLLNNVLCFNDGPFKDPDSVFEKDKPLNELTKYLLKFSHHSLSIEYEILRFTLLTTYNEFSMASYNSTSKALDYFHSKNMIIEDFCKSEYYEKFLDILYMIENRKCGGDSIKEKQAKKGDFFLNTKSNKKVEITDTESKLVKLKYIGERDDKAVWLPLVEFYDNYVKLEIRT